jgi:hypothetical protein
MPPGVCVGLADAQSLHTKAAANRVIIQHGSTHCPALSIHSHHPPCQRWRMTCCRRLQPQGTASQHSKHLMMAAAATAAKTAVTSMCMLLLAAALKTTQQDKHIKRAEPVIVFIRLPWVHPVNVTATEAAAQAWLTGPLARGHVMCCHVHAIGKWLTPANSTCAWHFPLCPHTRLSCKQQCLPARLTRLPACSMMADARALPL